MSNIVQTMEYLFGGIFMITGFTMLILGFQKYIGLTSGIFGFFGNFNPSWMVPIAMGFTLIIFGVIFIFLGQNAIKNTPGNPGEREL